jgi:hypothetical protein
MPHEARRWLSRIKAVEREHGAVLFAVQYLFRALHEGHTPLRGSPQVRDLDTATKRLDGTYTIRLFAEFESGLKEFLRSQKLQVRRDAKPLLDRVAARARIPGEILRNAHGVREYRNNLVHDRVKPTQAISIRQATSALCTFLARLEAIW